MDSLERAKALIEKRPRCNQRQNERERRALGFACIDGDIDAVKYLCENGADINGKIGTHTFLYQAIAYKKIQVAKFLIDMGANVNFQDKDNDETPLHKATMCHEPDYDIITYLLDAGADNKLKNKNGYTASMMACGYGHPGLAEYIESFVHIPTKGVHVD